MKIGLTLPQMGAKAGAAVRDFIPEAERMGFDSIWVQDHFMRPYEPEPGPEQLADYNMAVDLYGTIMQPLELLSYAAARTTRMTLGTSILVFAYRRPLQLARQLATLDHLSDGRVVCGLGIGWSKDEYRQAGTPFEDRSGRFDEFIDALRASWLPDPVEFHGRHFDIPPCHSGPKPVQRNAAGEPAIPIVVGASEVPAGLRRVAEQGDGWTTDGRVFDPAELMTHVDSVRAAARERGRNDQLTVYMRVFLLPTLPDVPDGTGGYFGPYSWRGTPGELAERVVDAADAGVDHLMCETNFWDTCPSSERWVELVGELGTLVDAAHQVTPTTT